MARASGEHLRGARPGEVAAEGRGASLLRRIVAQLERASFAATAVLFVLMLGAVLLQIAARYVLPDAPIWTEEITRFLLVYLVAAACGLAVRRRELVQVDLVVNLLPASARKLLLALVDLLVLTFSLIFAAHAVRYVENAAIQTATTLPIAMSWITAAVLLIPGSLAVFTLANLVLPSTGGSSETP